MGTHSVGHARASLATALWHPTGHASLSNLKKQVAQSVTMEHTKLLRTAPTMDLRAWMNAKFVAAASPIVNGQTLNQHCPGVGKLVNASWLMHQEEIPPQLGVPLVPFAEKAQMQRSKHRSSYIRMRITSQDSAI
jgi:hypothetical protein